MSGKVVFGPSRSWASKWKSTWNGPIRCWPKIHTERPGTRILSVSPINFLHQIWTVHSQPARCYPLFNPVGGRSVRGHSSVLVGWLINGKSEPSSILWFLRRVCGFSWANIKCRVWPTRKIRSRPTRPDTSISRSRARFVSDDLSCSDFHHDLLNSFHAWTYSDGFQGFVFFFSFAS